MLLAARITWKRFETPDKVQINFVARYLSRYGALYDHRDVAKSSDEDSELESKARIPL